MTCNERIEKTLNRAGQTFDESRDYTQDETYSAMSTPFLELVMKYLECVRLIDTMETALENVCGERDYLRKVIEKEVPCLICVIKECPAYDEPCNSCLLPDGETMVNYEYAGAPGDWRADDD